MYVTFYLIRCRFAFVIENN